MLSKGDSVVVIAQNEKTVVFSVIQGMYMNIIMIFRGLWKTLQTD